MSKPIFVIGVHRSGTTWLANILIQHSNISGVQNKRHFGIYESAFFENIMDNFGNLKEDNNFNHCMETFTLTDFFILSGIDKNILYKQRPKNYYELFRMFMDSFAKKEKVDFWLEKTPIHTLYLNEISKQYPDAKFIAIKRDIIDTIKSTIKMHYSKPNENKPLKSRLSPIIYFTYRYVKYYKYIQDFCKKSNSILLINYDELKKSKEQIIKKICKFLEIQFEPSMLAEKYKPNTSFTDNSQRKEALTTSNKLLIKKMAILFSIFPYKLYSIFNPIEKMIRKNKLPTWFNLITEENKLKEQKKIYKTKNNK